MTKNSFFFLANENFSQFHLLYSAQMRRVRYVEAGGLIEAFQKQNKCLQSIGLAVAHCIVLQGSNPHGFRAFLGAQEALVPRARIQERISGKKKKK